MKSKYIATSCSNSLNRIMTAVGEIAQNSKLRARILSLPLGVLLALSLPLIRITSFIEGFLLFLVNLLGAPFSSDCTLQDAGYALKSAVKEIVGILISPFIAIFVGTALITSIMVDPLRATKKFASTCQNHGERCKT